MDLSKPIAYRGMQVNTLTENGRMLKGIVVENADYSGVTAVGYTEKRAAADGIHASDVYLGPRIIELSGFIYEPTLAELFDTLHLMRSAFSPTAAYQESPGDRGFLPLTFSQPTLDSDFPTGVTNLQLLARPEAGLRFTLNRDRLADKGLVDGVPGSAKSGVRAVVAGWASRLIAKDPRVYVLPEQSFALLGIKNSLTDGIAVNRGDYETPMNMQLIVAATPAADANFRLTGLNGVDMTITVKRLQSDGTTLMPPTIYRWFGDDRVLMTQSITPENSPLVLRMDLVTMGQANRKPMVAPGSPTFKYSHTADLASGSRLFWSEAFA